MPNVSDPSGLNCTDVLVADMGTGVRLGANFPTLTIDNAGNIYAAWSEAPATSSANVTGDTVLKYTYSTDQGITWAPPMMIDTSGSPVGTLHTNVFPWLVAGDDGRVGLAWYGTPGAPTYPSRGPDSCTPATCSWSVWYVQSLNAHAASPAFTAPVQASQHFIHRGSVQTLIGGQNGDRTLGDFLQVRIGAFGEAQISYADSNNINHSGVPHAMFVRQNGGEGLLNVSPVQISGLTPFNSVSDPTGDGRYEANSTVSANMPQLDILGSSVRLVTTAPCSDAAPCYEVVMQINNLSLAPTLTQDPDQDLVWHTQWLIPSQTNPQGGKNFFVYAESFNGSALQCFAGENAQNRIGGGVSITYPGATTLPAANCQSKLGPNGHITIYVPLTAVSEKDPIDNKLHEVTASTMTLQDRANTIPSVNGLGGSFFNVIDVAQSYVFDPNQATSPPGVQLLNISGRVFVQTGDRIGDAGLIIRGSGTKRLLVRGLGPSLPVPGALQDPVIELYDNTGAQIEFNDNWRATQQSEVQQTGIPPADDREAAIVAMLPAGTYTAVIRGANGSTGNALFEVYDLDPPSGSEFANLSMRADVQTDDNVLIDGTIIGGTVPKRVLFRAIGPSLSSDGTAVEGRMEDPTMELYDTNGTVLATNNDWKDAANAAEIQAVLPPPDDRESAILLTLAPGNYTSVVRGVNRTTGIALNEIYKIGD